MLNMVANDILSRFNLVDLSNLNINEVTGVPKFYLL